MSAPDRKPSPPRLGWVWSLLRPYRFLLCAVGLAVALHSSLNLAMPAVIRRLVEGLSEPTVSARMEVINTSLLMLGAIFAMQGLLSYLEGMGVTLVGERVTSELRLRTFRHILHLPLRFFAERQVGEVSVRLTDDAQGLRALVTDSLPALVRHGLAVVAVFVLLFFLNPTLTLLALGGILVVALGGTLVIGRIQKAAAAVQDKQAKALGVAAEAMNNIAIIKSFVREEFIFKRVQSLVTETMRLVLARNAIQAAIVPLTNILAFGVVGVIIWMAARQVVNGSMTGPELLAYLIYAGMMIGSVSQVSTHIGKINQALGAAGHIAKLLDTEIEDSTRRTSPPAEVHGDLAFSGVTFAYSQASRPAIRSFTVSIPAGTTVALVGPSGAGKSTLVNLLIGAYRAQEGTICLDGREIDTLPLDWLREQVGIVLQETFLFSGTIRENICFGRTDAPEAEFLAAARAANVHEFAERLPQGYETLVGERGATLSRGQCQRVAIARMLLKNPRIVVLDEATASLDPENEELVQDALQRLTAGRTCLLIAHRPATIRTADRILVLVDGHLIEDGTHSELLAKGGLYARLFPV